MLKFHILIHLYKYVRQICLRSNEIQIRVGEVSGNIIQTPMAKSVLAISYPVSDILMYGCSMSSVTDAYMYKSSPAIITTNQCLSLQNTRQCRSNYIPGDKSKISLYLEL